MNSSVLFVLTSHSHAGDIKTGFHFEEMAVPYYLLQDAGIPVVLASIKGGTPHPSPASIDSTNARNNPENARRFLNDIEAMYKLENTKSLGSYDAHRFGAIYLVGGPGALWDFPRFAPLQCLVLDLYREGKSIAAISQGSAGLLGIKDAGDYILKDRRISAPSSEEQQQESGSDLPSPFRLEDRLRQQGAQIQCGECGQPFCIKDHPFLTAQNHASAPLLGERLRNHMTDSTKQIVLTL